MKRAYTLIVDHFQFYLADEDFSTDTRTIWNTQEIRDLAVVSHDLIAVGTRRSYGATYITVEITDGPVIYQNDAYDHIVEGSITTTSGMLLLFTAEGDERTTRHIPVAPRTYETRILYKNLASVIDEFEHTGDDSYHLVLWPGKQRETTVRKRYRRGNHME